MATKPATLKIPKTLAAVADLYYTKKEERLALQRQADLIEADEKLLKTLSIIYQSPMLLA